MCVQIDEIDRMSNIATTTVIEKYPIQIDRLSNVATTSVIEKYLIQIDRLSNVATTSVIKKTKMHTNSGVIKSTF